MLGLAVSLTAGQEKGIVLIHDWYKAQNEQIFKLGGFAGTGKSFMTKLAIENLSIKKSQVAFCALTGKASLVIAKYLDDPEYSVGTIHKLIYEVIDDYRLESTRFQLKKALLGIKLIVVDEASMVSLSILEDLKQFGINILAIGDPGQLPAVGVPSGLMDNPDHMLDEIMRQNLDNPIIYLSMLARQQKRVELGDYGTKVRVIKKSEMNIVDMVNADQVICGFNRTLHKITKDMRIQRGMLDDTPQFGDKVIITKNDWNKSVQGFNLVNGMIGYIRNEPRLITHPDTRCLGMKVWEVVFQADFLSEPFNKVLYVPESDFKFENEKIDFRIAKKINRMQYGQITTCHKAQGDQFDTTFVINESFGDEPWRWLYTAITRAQNGMTLALY